MYDAKSGFIFLIKATMSATWSGPSLTRCSGRFPSYRTGAAQQRGHAEEVNRQE